MLQLLDVLVQVLDLDRLLLLDVFLFFQLLHEVLDPVLVYSVALQLLLLALLDYVIQLLAEPPLLVFLLFEESHVLG